MGDHLLENEADEIHRLANLGLPPVTSHLALSVMIGINPGLTWSFINRPIRHYRHFTIPKGNGERHIYAPKVALKIIQKWLSVQLQKYYDPPQHVHGFIPGKSHISAAKQHTSSEWVYSVDIADFFPSTPLSKIKNTLSSIGYSEKSSTLLANLFCFNGHLAQGSPASPVLSNMAFREVDSALQEIASTDGIRLTRYADDIVFSGTSAFPKTLPEKILTALVNTPWTISPGKTELSISPRRRKVHGLLVSGDTVKLTKGYRNKIRAYRHLVSYDKIREGDLPRIRGHISYSKQIDLIGDD